MLVAILYEDNNPIRAFNDAKCIYSAFRWAHHHFRLGDYDPTIKTYELPEWLNVKLISIDEKQFNEIVK